MSTPAAEDLSSAITNVCQLYHSIPIFDDRTRGSIHSGLENLSFALASIQAAALSSTTVAASMRSVEKSALNSNSRAQNAPVAALNPSKTSIKDIPYEIIKMIIEEGVQGADNYERRRYLASFRQAIRGFDELILPQLFVGIKLNCFHANLKDLEALKCLLCQPCAAYVKHLTLCPAYLEIGSNDDAAFKDDGWHNIEDQTDVDDLVHKRLAGLTHFRYSAAKHGNPGVSGSHEFYKFGVAQFIPHLQSVTLLRLAYVSLLDLMPNVPLQNLKEARFDHVSARPDDFERFLSLQRDTLRRLELGDCRVGSYTASQMTERVAQATELDHYLLSLDPRQMLYMRSQDISDMFGGQGSVSRGYADFRWTRNLKPTINKTNSGTNGNAKTATSA